MLSEKLKDREFKTKLLLCSFIILCVASYFLNVLTNKDPFYEIPYFVSALYLCPIISLCLDYISCGRKILLALIGGIFIATLIWLGILALVYIGTQMIKYLPFEFKKLTLFQAFLVWFFITIPLSLFFSMGVILWVLCPIFYLSECLKKKHQFKVSDIFSKKSLGDFAVNPFRLLLMYFSLPWIGVRFILRKFLGIEK